MNEMNESLGPNTQKLIEIKAIDEGGVTFQSRTEIAKYVETPLVSACEHFWDIGIQTVMSSANSRDVGNIAYIDLDYNSLSDENKKIAESLLGQKGMMHGSEPTSIIKVNILPITTETTLEKVKDKADEIANRFKKQKATWIPAMTLQYLRKLYTGDQNDTEFGIEDFTNYYYDNKTQLFYNNKECYDKVNEATE